MFFSSSLSAIRVVSFAYLRLLIFLLAVLIPTCASPSPVFLMMYSAYKLNKQGDNMRLWHTPFLICNQSVVPCPVLTVASWPAYRFLRRQVRWSGIPISFRIFHILLWSTVKGFSIVIKAEVDVFLELSCLVAEMVKYLPTMRETRVRSLGGEDTLEKEMATHSSTFAWKIPWEEPGRLQSMGLQRVRHDWATLLLLAFWWQLDLRDLIIIVWLWLWLCD